MNDNLKQTITENAAYVEDSSFEFEGFTVEFHGKNDGCNSEHYHCAPNEEHGKVHVGKVTGKFEGFVSKEGWQQLIRAGVEITLAELKAAPELLKPLFALFSDCIRAILEEKRQNRELRKAELELEILKLKTRCSGPVGGQPKAKKDESKK